MYHNQMYPYFDKPLLKSQCGFQKGFNAQHYFITMKEKRSVHGGGQAGGLLTDPSKAFDCIDHEFLIAKSYACGFDKKFLVLY